MDNRKFIETISQNNSNYTSPEQAINQANSLDLLSKDIYTDSERFIYELLQNADDASNQSGILDFRIDFIDQYVVISHNGEPFSQVDIESISSAGDGTKSGDINKTGYKGIGFKSVFAHSNFVIIKSGNYCFKFDKQHWVSHWNQDWVPKSAWQAARKSKNKDQNLKMPWQIIPIWTELPVELRSSPIFNEYNVSTIIRFDKIEQLKKTLTDLFSESQIVLFLRSKRVKVLISLNKEILLEKDVNGEETTLKRNGKNLSNWLIKTYQFQIPKDVQKELDEDEKTPKKLKEATQTEISFAIQVDDGNLKVVDKENRLIFTYLPTSINYNFPFLVNASFLTDAGRQHLHQDAFWNNWLFKQIPVKFFSWVSVLANKESKYNKQFLNIVPNKLGGTLLESSFNEGFDKALQSVAFIPNLKGDLNKVKESLLDITNISQFINSQTLINYINSSKNKRLSISSYTPYLEPISTLSRLGTQMFEIDDLEGFFASSIFAQEHKLGENFNLISFLYEQSQRNKGDDNRNIWNQILRHSAFIFDEKEVLKTPSEIYFPEVEFTKEFSNEISIIHGSTVSKINANSKIKNWLENLGVQAPSDISFIEKTIIGNGAKFVTKKNVIEIGRYLFNVHKKGTLQNHHYEKLQKLYILSKENNLIPASNSYLSDFYEPDLKIEKVNKNDIFITEKYYQSQDLKDEWKTFFIKIGANQKINQVELIKLSISSLAMLYGDEYFDIDSGALSKEKYLGMFGYGSHNLIDPFRSISLIENTTHNYLFAKIFWHEVFNKNEIDLTQLTEPPLLWYGIGKGENGFGYNIKFTYIEWFIKNRNCIPTTQKSCLIASNVYSSSIPLINEIAGEYLPVFDYEGAIPPEWQNLLNFITNLGLAEYLVILSSIWKENNKDEQVRKENIKRIGLIYEKMALMNFHSSEKEKISEWASSNKLLAKNGLDFYYPKDLSIVTVDGFKATHLAYAEKQSTEIIELLRLFGVQIIDSVNATIPNNKTEVPDLKTKLLRIAPLIALVSIEKSKNIKEWENEFERINKKFSVIRFFETTEIYLSYGNDEDKQKRSSWADDHNFYYVGKWDSPRVLDGLVEPLGTYLNIRYAERILTVLLLENVEGGIEYLKEKGFDISLILDHIQTQQEEYLITSKVSVASEDAKLKTEQDNDLPLNEQIEALRVAKEVVQERLESEGYIFTQGIGMYSTVEGVVKGSTLYPLVVKSYINTEESLKINPIEWNHLIQTNSMLWIHFGNRILRCIKVNELLRKQDKLSISFSTENLEKEDRINNFANLLRYFGNVHFNFDTIDQNNFNSAEQMGDYRFNERNKEKDLSGDDLAKIM